MPLESLRPAAAALTAIVLVAEPDATDLRSGPRDTGLKQRHSSIVQRRWPVNQ